MFRTYTPPYKPTVLVVEDNFYLRKLLTNILQRQYQVLSVANGLEALKAIKTTIPDLVVTDIIMPYVDGYELIQNLRRSGLYKDIPVLVISGCDNREITDGLNGAGITEIFEKPFNPEKLVARIGEVLLSHKVAG